eukprot:TRINITY_DN2816_c0_g2_i7.p1 TRINITY_DN2816_c0_g2~~TRINITY_DN2816_c0_g2_i7.p1  ORF type:complete len:486 (+),score=177.36 TRINITY_DN2816_c0_g2_i7:55-1512(+)
MLGVAKVLAAAAVTAAAPAPHVVFFLADDFGHYDSTVWNPDAPTPTLGKLAAEGIKLDRHYVYQFCSPTRSSFVSGRLPIHVNTENHPSSEAGGVDLRMQTVADKLKSAGYATHQVGKWHAGAYLAGQVPTARGFDSSLGYLNGMEDHYTHHFGILNGTDMWNDTAPAYGTTGQYGDDLYVARSLRIIAEHDTAAPLFLYHAFQNTHTPYQVPEEYVDPSDPEKVQAFFGMIRHLDTAVLNITNALKARDMWRDTIVVFSADNGGECLGKSAGNNYPLRGCKYSDFEGGVRATAFVSGGSALIPAGKRGTTSTALVHICDWYATFAAMAGVDTADAPGHGVPASDGVDVWAALTADAPPPRTEVPLSAKSVISSVNGTVYKYVTDSKSANVWTPKDFPLSPAVPAPSCAKGCVFAIDTDVREEHDLAAQLPDVTAALQKRVAENAATKWQTGADGYVGAYTHCTSLDSYMASHKGFIGPLCSMKH